jgi:hypothetical protein
MKSTPFFKLKKVNKPRHSPFADTDRDGVINILDCKPNNPRKQDVYKWNDIKHKVINKKYLFHKTELSAAKQILKSGKLNPSMSGDFSMSEHHNPHVIFKTYKQPVTLVLEKKNIPNLKKVDYKKPQNLKYESEKEWVSPGGQTKKVLKGIIINERAAPTNLSDKEVGLQRTVIKSLPSRYVTEEDMHKIKFKGKNHFETI